MDKREMIERALAEYVITGSLTEQVKWDALADQAIVIECEVEHRIRDITQTPETRFRTNTLFYGPVEQFLKGYAKGHLGIPSKKAIAIILPLEMNDGETC